MVLALVIGQVFQPRVPVKCIHFLCNFVPNPEEMLFHRARRLAFDGIVCYAYHHGIVAMDVGFRLQMAHIGKCEAKYNPVWQLWYSALSSALAVEATTNFNIAVLT
jgi:hypothetical protein